MIYKEVVLRLSSMVIICLMIMLAIFSYGCNCGAGTTTPITSTPPSSMTPAPTSATSEPSTTAPTSTSPTTTEPTTTSPMTTSPPSPIGSNIPSLNIVSPEEGETINSSEVTVQVQVQNFQLVDKIGRSNVPGEGHLHFFLDVDAPTTAFEPAVTEQGTYAVSIEPSYTWTGLQPGMHKLSVELVNNDSSPVIPLVIAEVTIYVE